MDTLIKYKSVLVIQNQLEFLSKKTSIHTLNYNGCKYPKNHDLLHIFNRYRPVMIDSTAVSVDRIKRLYEVRQRNVKTNECETNKHSIIGTVTHKSKSGNAAFSFSAMTSRRRIQR